MSGTIRECFGEITKQIHIKATCENENRRFCISEAKFETLQQMISSIFSSQRGAEFIVKYKDDENDLVTISSDEELAFAVNLFPTDILRLVISPKHSLIVPDIADCADRRWCRKEKWNNEKRGHFLFSKRERVLACLKELEGSDFQANPKLFWKQEHLKRKLQNLDSKIANVDHSGHCGNKPAGRVHPCKGPMDPRRCHFLATKKEKILARLKELEGTDFQAAPGLLWKKKSFRTQIASH